MPRIRQKRERRRIQWSVEAFSYKRVLPYRLQSLNVAATRTAMGVVRSRRSCQSHPFIRAFPRATREPKLAISAQID